LDGGGSSGPITVTGTAIVEFDPPVMIAFSICNADLLSPYNAIAPFQFSEILRKL
jgi:hypothetical protein